MKCSKYFGAKWRGFFKSESILAPKGASRFKTQNIRYDTSLLTTRPNKLDLAISFQSSLTFAGNTRSLPKKEASERCSNWVGSGLPLKF